MNPLNLFHMIFDTGSTIGFNNIKIAQFNFYFFVKLKTDWEMDVAQKSQITKSTSIIDR